MIFNYVREADTFIQHFAFCISFAKFQIYLIAEFADMHIKNYGGRLI